MKRRMRNLFREDGKTLIVAMDHAAFSTKPLPGMKEPGDTIEKVIAGGADVVMTTFGTVTKYSDQLANVGLIVSMSPESPMLEYAVETALSIGADGIKCMVYPWLDTDPGSVTQAARLGAECHRWALPLLCETIPGGFMAGPEFRVPDKIAAAARIGAECGADFVKTFYTGDPESFKIVVENCIVPVIILGGARMDTDRDVLKVAKDAIDAGASGIAFGTNIWTHRHPDKIVAALSSIIHENASIEQALQRMN